MWLRIWRGFKVGCGFYESIAKFSFGAWLKENFTICFLVKNLGVGLKLNFKIFGGLADKNLRGAWLKFGGFMNEILKFHFG